MSDKTNTNSRRNFLQNSAIAGAALISGSWKTLSNNNLITQNNTMKTPKGTIKTKGYAAKDESGKLSAWEFERRPVGDDDILIDIKYASICHSDIHQEKGHWGEQQYPSRGGSKCDEV